MGESKRRSAMDGVAALFEEAVGHHRAGRLDDALRGYEAVLARAASHHGALNMRGVLALQRGDPSAALADFDRAVAAGGDGAGLHCNRGNALRALGRRADALADYDRALAIDPRFVGAHVNRGNVLRDDQHLERAAEAYRAALAIDPSSFPAAANLASVLMRIAAADPSERLAAGRAALDIAKRGGFRGAEVATLLNMVGVLHRAAERLDDAIASFSAAVAEDPAFAEAHVNLSRALTAVARYDEAIDPIRRAIALQPTVVGHLDALALLYRRLERNGDAADTYRTWMEIEPANPIPAHMVLALTGATPPTASADYVRREFDEFATKFDQILQTQLEYRAPELLRDALLSSLAADAASLDIVDLGCGTGLCGPLLRPRAARLVGVDLSPKMLELAVDRGYDDLVEDEIGAYCEKHPDEFDLAVAADVLVYIGELRSAFEHVRRALRDGGVFAFTVELAQDATIEYALGVGGRFAHSEAYVRAVLGGCGFDVVTLTEQTIRKELAAAVPGLVVVARQAAR